MHWIIFVSSVIIDFLVFPAAAFLLPVEAPYRLRWENQQVPESVRKLGVPPNCIFFHDLTATSLGMMMCRGDYPQMTASFRLVNYLNLPTYNRIYIYI